MDTDIEVPMAVQVTFLLNARNRTVEIYRLDSEDDMLCWRMNERLTPAIVATIRTVEFRPMSRAEWRETEALRLAMRRRIVVRVAQRRKEMQLAAVEQRGCGQAEECA